jgi:predicted DNA-binding transcriptional regulator YafY
MRAGRLLNILVLLETGRRVSARDLAQACEVSLRTIYRDVDALSAAGIPIMADRGAEGGYRLLEGYRVRLNGLSASEAEALFFAGLPGPARDLGLGAALTVAENKLLAALPKDLRQSAERVRSRFLFDTPAWFEQAEELPHLSKVAQAVWKQNRLAFQYQSWRGAKRRLVDPLGLVLKAGAWYLVGQVGSSVRSYRIARMSGIEVAAETFMRPEGFDLATYWKEATKRLDAELNPRSARIRVSREGFTLLPHAVNPYAWKCAVIDPDTDRMGWRTVTLPVGNDPLAQFDLLRLGAEIEVIEPLDLRAAMAKTTARLAQIYIEGESDFQAVHGRSH